MTKQWFEENEQYTIDDALGERQWPQSLSLTRVNPEDSKTQAGWGRRTFVQNYGRRRFAPDRILDAFVHEGLPFGIIMRSIPLICVDIDGKNGGIQASRILSLPETLAERSKSGNGYHLFYRVPEAVWHSQYGYDEFGDANGIIPGVDIRATGIVYHYPQQRWNQLDPVALPNTLRKLLTQRKQMQESERERKQLTLDPEDLAIAQEQALVSLAKAIPKGRRNQTLFAIGCEMYRLHMKDWRTLLIARGSQLGLEVYEVEQIIQNVKKYSV